MEHHLRDTPGQENLDRGMVARPIGEGVHEAGRASIDPVPILDPGRLQTGGVGDGRNVEQQVGGAPERGMDQHGVLQGCRGQDPGQGQSPFPEPHERQGRPPGRVQPDRLARRTQGRVRQGHSQSLGHHLRRGRSSQKLASPARRGAGPAPHGCGVLQADESVGETGADGLHRSRIFPVGGRQRDAAGDDDSRQPGTARQRHEHGRQSLVASSDPQDALSSREGPHQPLQDRSSVVTVGEAVHHPLRSLAPAVAGVAAIGRIGAGSLVPEDAGRRRRQQADLPVSRVVTQGQWSPIRVPQAALGAQDQIGLPVDLPGTPTHPHVLGPAEEIAAGLMEQHLLGQGELTLRPRAPGPHPGPLHT